MAEMGQRGRAACFASADAPGRAARAAALPVLAEFLAQFLAGDGPVVADGVAELGDVAFEVEFVLFEPGDVEFLPRGAALELAGDIFFVVANDSGEAGGLTVLDLMVSEGRVLVTLLTW